MCIRDRFTTDGVVFDDGATAQFDAVILATGYRPRVDEFVPVSYTHLTLPTSDLV